MIKLIEKNFLNFYKKHLMKRMTGNLGKVIEKDKIVCYVKKEI